MYSAKKSLTKKAITLACALSLCATTLPAAAPVAVAAADPFADAAVQASAVKQTVSDGYYYDNLTYSNGTYELGKKFYAALDGMRESGDFKDGTISFDLDGIVTSDQLKAWVEDGDLTVPKAFGAARDSFMMDHPELFYIDVYKIMINAGYSGGTYKGYLDSGREPNIYRDGAFSSVSEVESAIADYNAAVEDFANRATAQIGDINSIYNDDCKLAIAANNVIANDVKYDYAVYSDYLENGENAQSVASLAHTAYGALVNRKAVCSGYSFGYQAVMDYLGVPTVTVSGYSVGKDRSGNDTGGNVAHSWNYVRLRVADKNDETAQAVQASADEDDNAQYSWFAFDTTWNGVNSNKNKHSLMYSDTASEEHMPDPVISSSGYPLDYPALSPIPYEQATDPDSPQMNADTEFGGFKHQRICTPSGDSFTVKAYVSYNGKNSRELAATENLRLAQRTYYMQNGEKKWTDWQDLAVSAEYAELGHIELGIEDQTDKTFTYISQNMQYYQYAVVANTNPDVSGTQYGTTFENMFYSAGLIENNAIYISDEFENPVYGTYTPAPYIVAPRSSPIIGTDVNIGNSMSEPGNSSMVADNKALTVKLVYDEPLYVLDPSKDIEVVVTARVPSALEYSGLAKYPDGKYVHLTNDENGVPNTLEFRFKPSLMFEHNRVGYRFSFRNIGSAKIVEKKTDSGELVRTTSDRAPGYAYYVFSRVYRVCPKVFGDGRLYVDCCAQPTLVDNSDLSATGFEDENGNSTFSESARSQMMLVVNDVSPKTESDILNEIDADSSNGIGKSDIVKSQTYDINLQICGKTAKIPDRSYVRLALGFPEGYGPDNEGVTFKIFHRKHKGGDVYEIEEIPCVVTKFGIVVTVDSFSPYTVAVVPKDKANTKTIAASIDGKGGTLGKDDGRIRRIAEGGSYTYDLTPNDGYQIYKVLLNDKDVTADVTTDNKLTVSYDGLSANNELEIKYISDDAKIRYTANNIVDPVKVVVPVGADLFGKLNNSPTPTPESPKGSPNVGLIVGLVMGGVVLALAAVATVLIIKKRNTSKDAKQTAGATSKSTSAAAAKPAQQRPTATGSSARPTQQRPTTTSSSARPAQQRPTATGSSARPAQQRPTTNSPARPAQQRPTTTGSSARPTQQRPTTTSSSARPAQQRPTTTSSSARPAQQRPTTTNSSARPAQQRPTTTNSSTRPTQQRPTTTNSSARPAQQRPTTNKSDDKKR